jgi:hypothetical protein
MNSHLVDVEIVMEKLFGGDVNLTDGTNLIYALEHATGESMGKYRKVASMQGLFACLISQCIRSITFRSR